LKIFYGICGEGFGHSGRSLALIERLSALGHKVTIFTFGDALRMLRDAGYQPHPILGLHFGESRDGGVNVPATTRNFVRFLRERHRSIDFIRQLAIAERPDLFITDFDPLTPIAALSVGVPCVSIDSQHRFCRPLGREFPPRLRAYGRMAGAFVRRWIKSPTQSIVAVFHRLAANGKVKRVDALIRGRIANLQPTNGELVLLYARGELGRRMVAIARGVPAKFVVYGSQGEAAPNLEFRRSSFDGFAADLAASRAVVCAGGQQLIGEAGYFGKPLLVIPIPRQHEQEINARYAELEGIGEFCPIGGLTPKRISVFLDRRYSIARSANGVDQILDLLGICNGRI
jgi:uncharacterized protein (TIGR00661 family)